jgi:uncharacterized protein YjbI with pentapeptide repeats
MKIVSKHGRVLFSGKVDCSYQHVRELVEEAIICGIDLADADFSHQDLREFGTRLPSGVAVQLRGALFTGSDLSDAKLEGFHLNGACFRETNFADAKLAGASLVWCDFTSADLSRADLSQALLQESNFTDATLRHTDLSGANLYGAQFSGANLAWANLCGVDLSGADLSSCDLHGVYMDLNAILRTNFRSVKMRNTLLSNTLMQLSLPM